MSCKQVQARHEILRSEAFMNTGFFKRYLYAQSTRMSLLAAGLAIALPMAATCPARSANFSRSEESLADFFCTGCSFGGSILPFVWRVLACILDPFVGALLRRGVGLKIDHSCG